MIHDLPLTALRESTTNPRRSFPKDGMADLEKSIREHGLLQPILVRPVAPKGKVTHEVVCGARRFRAAKAAGLITVPVLVRDLSNKAALEVQFVENLQRVDVHPLEEGIGYSQLMREHGYTVESIAARLQKSKSYVYSRLKLSELPPKAQTLFLEGKIDVSHAILVARIATPELAERAAAEIAKGNIWDGSPLPYRKAVELVQDAYQCNLREAAFPTADKTLVPSAGSCAECPKRTGNQKDLFGDVARDDVHADVCTDPSCFRAKLAAFGERRKAEILQVGGRVVEGKAAKGMTATSGTVDPDSVASYDDPKQRTWRQLTKGADLAALKPTIVLAPDEAPVERWDAAAVKKIAKEKGVKLDQGDRSTPARPSAEDQAHKLRTALAKDLVATIAEKAAAIEPKHCLALVVAHSLRRALGAKWLEAQRRDAIDWDKLEDMTMPELQGLALQLVAAPWGNPSSNYGGWGQPWLSVCRALGIDLGKAERAERERRKQLKAAKAKPARKAVAKR